MYVINSTIQRDLRFVWGRDVEWSEEKEEWGGDGGRDGEVFFSGREAGSEKIR